MGNEGCNSNFDQSLMERKEVGKRGRKPGRKSATERMDVKAKLERSRQSARECRARKKLRYQYLEELVCEREKAVLALREELDRCLQWSRDLNNLDMNDESHKMFLNELLLNAQ